MYKKLEPQSALSLGYSNMPPKSGEVTLAWESAMPSCSTEKSSTKSYAPRNYPHTPEQIAEEIRVDEEGRLWWKKQAPGRVLSRSIGIATKSGYPRVNFNYTYYKAHTIAFCLYYGRWPSKGMVIDHIDRNPRNNHISNLREVSQAINSRNSKAAKTRGITYNHVTKKWKAQLTHNYKNIYGGEYLTIDEAVNARHQLETTYWNDDHA